MSARVTYDDLLSATRDAEQYVLSAIMLNPRAAWDVFAIVSPGDFLQPNHEAIAEALLALANRNAPTDPIATGDELRRRGEQFDVAYLHQLHSYAPTSANAGFYADIVKRESLTRAVRSAAAEITSLTDAGGDAFEVAERSRQILDDATAASAVDLHPIGDALPGVVEQLEGQPHYVETPWKEINGYIHGFKPGGVYVIGARPGAGKSIMALQAAAALAEHGNVAFASLEMDESELVKRLIAMRASVPMGALARSTLTPEDWQAVAKARAGIAEMRLFIDDRSGVSLTQVQSFARSVSRKGPLSAIVIDYLQLMPASDKRKARSEQVGELTRQVKALARDMKVPVLLLSQLNRESEKTGQRRLPSMQDLRESGSIEQDADVVMLLQRRHDKDGNATDDLDVVIGKNRQGQTGRVSLLWEGKYARMSSHPWNPFAGFADTTDWKARQAHDE